MFGAHEVGDGGNFQGSSYHSGSTDLTGHSSVARFAGSVQFLAVTPGSAASPGAITLYASFAGSLDVFVQLISNYTALKLCQESKKLFVCSTENTKDAQRISNQDTPPSQLNSIVDSRNLLHLRVRIDHYAAPVHLQARRYGDRYRSCPRQEISRRFELRHGR